MMDPASVLFEDNHLFVVNKPAGALVQHGGGGGVSQHENNLLNTVKAHLVARDGKPGRAWVGLVHRLDRPTSGVIAFAKTSKAAARLSESFRTRACRKLYLAVVHGAVAATGTLTHHLVQTGDGASSPVRMHVVSSGHRGAASATLHYRPLATFTPPPGHMKRQTELTAVHVTLETGRKHQIRAQLAHAGHPIVGDAKYGAPQAFAARDIALHAWSLTLPHPVSHADVTFTAPPPAVWTQRFGDAAMNEVLDGLNTTAT